MFFFVVGWKKWVFHQFGFYNPKISKNWASFLIFSDYRIRTPPKHYFFMVLMQFGLRNQNCTNTNYEHVCNMDSHFKDNINLPNFHPCAFMILFDIDRPFFLVVFKSKIQNCWNERDYDCRLYICIVRIMKSELVRIMKSELQRGIFENFTGCVWLS